MPRQYPNDDFYPSPISPGLETMLGKDDGPDMKRGTSTWSQVGSVATSTSPYDLAAFRSRVKVTHANVSMEWNTNIVKWTWLILFKNRDICRKADQVMLVIMIWVYFIQVHF